MLVLSRKAGEAITIGGNVTIRLICVEKGRVRLGIEAPQTVRVTRPECQKPLAAERLPKPVSV